MSGSWFHKSTRTVCRKVWVHVSGFHVPHVAQNVMNTFDVCVRYPCFKFVSQILTVFVLTS